MHPIAATTNVFLAPQALSFIIPPVPICLSTGDIRVFLPGVPDLRRVAIGRAAFVADSRRLTRESSVTGLANLPTVIAARITGNSEVIGQDGVPARCPVFGGPTGAGYAVTDGFGLVDAFAAYQKLTGTP